MMRQCNLCQCWDPPITTRHGVCHAYPASTDGFGGPGRVFTKATDWCVKGFTPFQEKQKAAADRHKLAKE